MATKATKVSRSARAFVHDRAPAAVGETASTTGGPDYAEILRSTGEAAYEWQIDSDRLTWSDNATALFGLRDRRPIASGRAYASLLDAGNATTRFDAVFHSPEADSGAGVAYQIQYALRVGARAPKLWVEDTGRARDRHRRVTEIPFIPAQAGIQPHANPNLSPGSPLSRRRP